MINAALGILDIISIPFGYVIRFAYSITGNYLISMIFFALVVKIIMFPLGIKQQKNSVKQASLRPKESAIRRKYAGREDKATQQKLQQEIMELYQKENFSPFSGCLPLLVQMPIILALYSVIRQPLTYIARLGTEAVEKLHGVFNVTADSFSEITLAQKVLENKQQALSVISESEFAKVPDVTVGGFNLGIIPKDCFGQYTALFIAVLVITFITSYGGQWLTRKFSYQPPTANNQSSLRLMNVMLPLFSVYIAYIVPVAVAFYWAVQNLLSPLQQFILSKIYPIPEYSPEELKQLEKEFAAQEKKKPRKVTEEVKRRSIVYDDDDDEPETTGKPLATENRQNTPAPKTAANAKKKKKSGSGVIEMAPLKDNSAGAESQEEESGEDE